MNRQISFERDSIKFYVLPKETFLNYRNLCKIYIKNYLNIAISRLSNKIFAKNMYTTVNKRPYISASIDIILFPFIDKKVIDPNKGQ